MPVLLIIAGLDPSGGAGFLCDARVAGKLGARAVGAVTAHTVQDTAGVRALHPVPAEVVGDELAALLADVEVDAVKIGMLAGEEITDQVASALALTRAPAVWDPVTRPSLGKPDLYRGDLRRAAELLAPHVTLVTPNAREASLLGERPVDDLSGARAAAEAIRRRFGMSVLVTGGHLTRRSGQLAGSPGASEPVVDLLVTDRGAVEIEGERIEGGENVHGTGCALSTAIACALAGDVDIEAACRKGAAYVRERLRHPAYPGRGRPAI